MASVHIAACKCGFEKEIMVGGLMDGFQEDSKFPFYCQHCGLVEVNIAKFIGKTKHEIFLSNRSDNANSATCPECGSASIDQYGTAPASLQADKQRQTLQAWGFQAGKEGNLCPKCKQMTLVFNHAHIRFD